jgi:ABC-type phosphate transport system substrate-binding protein
MNTTLHILRAAMVTAALAGAASFAQAEVVVVVSAKSAATAITSDQAADIFLGKSSTLPGGGQAVPVDQAEGATRDEFYQKAMGKNAAQLKAYWSKQIFSGKGQPPKEVGDGAATRGLIANNPNLIGYIDKSLLDGSVKQVLSLQYARPPVRAPRRTGGGRPRGALAQGKRPAPCGISTTLHKLN